MKIVRADSQHLDSVIFLFDQYRQFYKLPSDIPSATSFIKERLQKNDSVIFLAMDDENHAMGFVQLYPSFSSLSMKPLMILNDLYVSPDHRKKSVAKYLLSRSEEYALEVKAKGLTLMTAIDNQPAQELYISQGWKQVTQFATFSKSF